MSWSVRRTSCILVLGLPLATAQDTHERVRLDLGVSFKPGFVFLITGEFHVGPFSKNA